MRRQLARVPRANAEEVEEVEAILGRLQDAMARREHLAPDEWITIEGVEFSHATLARLARLGPNQLLRIGCEVCAIRRQLLTEAE
ncbi:MAG: hypothetical protein Q7R40_00030 [Phaeospirillum sp.]|nr:hypothetical protein [Phaeospirillum sp.]